MNRGACHQAVFLDPTDRARFLDELASASLRSNVEVHGYCLVGNHFHLLIRTPEPSLDTAMQLLLGNYTRYFNDRHGRDGALFRGRYKSILIDSERYLLAVSRYVHRNALDVVGTHIADWPWSSYPIYLGLATPKPWLYTKKLLELAGGLESYKHLVESLLPSDIDHVFEQSRLPSKVSSSGLLKGRV